MSEFALIFTLLFTVQFKVFIMGHETRLDANYKFPSGMQEYLDTYGWHFSKKMCEWAVSKMKRKNPQTQKEEPLEYMDKDETEEFLKKYNVVLDNVKGYDHVYILAMVRSDFFKSAITDEQHLALYVKDFFGDTDGYPTMAFTRFYADCIGSGTPIQFDDML